MVDPIIWLTEIDEDVGHTLVHYLYTGEYQTLRESEHRRHTEYKRSVLVYCAASNLEIVDLGDMALGLRTRSIFIKSSTWLKRCTVKYRVGMFGFMTTSKQD